MTVTRVWDTLTDFFIPKTNKKTSSTEEKVEEFMVERIKRSPSHWNLSQIADDEPQWYRD